MNENKICFIINGHDEIKYQESLKYINALIIPEGFEIEILTSVKHINTPAFYNTAMLSSDAKYKIYLEESTSIIDKQFLYSLISLFRENQDIGMVGAIGAKQIPETFNWIESNYKVGSIYAYQGECLEFIEYSPSVSGFEETVVLDSSILATQFDIPFCEEDLIYDLSQSVKFIENGYNIGVLIKEQPFVILDRKLNNERSSKLPLDIKKINSRLNVEWKSDLPLVSILIPTYNRPKYFELALKSALEQTYENIEIVIGDDSTNNLTESLVKDKYLPYYNNIRYIRNKTNLGQFDNDLKLMELSRGEYINFLMDDDLFHPEKIEKMMDYFINDKEGEIVLVTSHRTLINETGDPYKDGGVTQKVFKEDTIMDGIEFGNILLKFNFNFIGEPTTVLFRKKDLTEPFGTFAGRKYGCIVDSATWLTLLSKGKGVYISDTLSFFRIHGNQQLQTEKMKILGATDYAYQVVSAKNIGFLENEEDYRFALVNSLNYARKIAENKDSAIEQLNELINIIRYNEQELNVLEENKLIVASNNIKQFYKRDCEKLIIFLVPGMNFITGGILSIYSIYKETGKLFNIHGSETIMSTMPNSPILLKNTNFENEVNIFPFELTLNYFHKLKKCMIHIPECYIADFINNLSVNEKEILNRIEDLQVNILNQNDELMPTIDVINQLYDITDKITCTTAHERYTTLEKRIEYGVPIHLFSTYVSPERYINKNYEEKEDILVVSPDNHPLKEEILNRIRKELPSIQIIVVQNLKYEEYKSLISRAKWSITFGEGLDGYFGEMIFSGGIGIAVYNNTFFAEKFRNSTFVYDDFNSLFKDIINDLKCSNEKSLYKVIQQEQFNLLVTLYDSKQYVENIKNFYLNKYDYM